MKKGPADGTKKVATTTKVRRPAANGDDTKVRRPVQASARPVRSTAAKVSREKGQSVNSTDNPRPARKPRATSTARGGRASGLKTAEASVAARSFGYHPIPEPATRQGMLAGDAYSDPWDRKDKLVFTGGVIFLLLIGFIAGKAF